MPIHENKSVSSCFEVPIVKPYKDIRLSKWAWHLISKFEKGAYQYNRDMTFRY